MKPVEFYNSKLDYCSEILFELKKKLVWNSIVRLISFVLVFISLFGVVSYNLTLAIALSIIFLIVFLWFVRAYIALQKKKVYYSNYKQIVLNEIDSLNYDFRNFKDGEIFINHRHNYSYDLDLFGKGSIFPMINRTITQSGEKLLAGSLLEDEINHSAITNAQEVMRELAQKPEFLLHFRTTGMASEIPEEEKNLLVIWCSKELTFSKRKVLKVISYAFPLLTLFALIMTIFYDVNISLFIILFLTNMGIVVLNLKAINKEHNQISRFLKMFQKYQGLIHTIEVEKFASVKLNELHSKLFDSNANAAQAFTQLTKLVGAFDNRLNMVAALFLEGLLMYDYHCLFAVEKWREKYGSLLLTWLEQVAEMDVQVSKANFAFNNSEFVYPTLSTTTMFKAKAIGHPLIHNSVRVSNNFILQSKGDFKIITGANMAGKSTFLRTIGVNIVLAKCGLPVCAAEMEFRPVKIFTSMRTSDSLAENESYFYAELRRLKEMLTLLEKGEELFIILDEILKGTNSVDKQKGSFLALEKILHLKGTGIIATHDLALTTIMEKYPDKVKNQCFEIEIDNAKISFDYKLYEGVTQKMNAMLLMEQMGII